jgi:hypothetical protein
VVRRRPKQRHAEAVVRRRVVSQGRLPVPMQTHKQFTRENKIKNKIRIQKVTIV